jgi:hypothetical protein
MLGARRATVTLSAGLLQAAGLISHHRGRITIIDRAGLEAAACECYGVIEAELDSVVQRATARLPGRDNQPARDRFTLSRIRRASSQQTPATHNAGRNRGTAAGGDDGGLLGRGQADA